MKIISKTGKNLNFLETGVDGIYVLDHVAFKERFDEDGNNDWEKSSSKEKLQGWAEKNLPSEILEQFYVDILTAEEVFSQKTINWCGANCAKSLISKQLPIFQNSDNRMMEFDGRPIWWWTRSAVAGCNTYMWGVCADGGINSNDTLCERGFVPVLRKRKEPQEGEVECWERLKKVAEEYAQKHMHPHKTIVITQQGIELSEGEKASPFEPLD